MIRQCDSDAAVPFLWCMDLATHGELIEAMSAHREAAIAEVVAWLRDAPATGAYSSDIISREYREAFADASMKGEQG